MNCRSNLGLQNYFSFKQCYLADTKYWIENKTYSPEEIAIRFKHQIVSIHCFPNGNGRHSRMMADIIMESIFEEEIFTWHQSTMVRADEIREEYINSLKEADNGNISPLIEFAKLNAPVTDASVTP